MSDVADRIGNVTRQRYEQLVTRAKELIAQVAREHFSLADMALEIEPMRAVGGSMPNSTEDLFTVTDSFQMLADDIGVELRTVEDWRYTANPVAGEAPLGECVVHRSPHPRVGRGRWSAIEDACSTRAPELDSGCRTARSGSSASGSTGRSRWMRRSRPWPT
ncbi:hypothetical protein [Streptomyces chartreusis]|uniref:hypothetical protein n=1 Tax=Streptomyces chartreusis TaxID=1969 RepID=UPI002101499E|nr:hypothetical protein [Streptomyces chartreusis]